MLIQVTESGRPVTFNANEVVWVETMPESDPNAGKVRVVLKAGFIFCDQAHDQIVGMLCRDAPGSLAPLVRLETK